MSVIQFDRCASAAIVRSRAARRWFLNAHEAAAGLLVSREMPPIADNDDAPPVPVARPSKKPRHRALVKDLAGLRLWLDLESTGATWPPADNDNTPANLRGPSEQRRLETGLDLLPSVEQMMTAAEGAEPERDGARVTLGGLRFERGRLTGWRSSTSAPWRKPAEIYGSRRVSQAGGTGSDRAVRGWMAGKGGWPEEPHRRVEIAPPAAGWPIHSAGRDWIDVAAPWRSHPPRQSGFVPALDTPVTRCPSPALPTVGRLAEQFNAGRCRASGQAVPGGPDLSPQEAGAVRAAEGAAVERLSPQDRRVLAVATRARTMADIGAIAGLSGKAAERAGSRMLVEASKNLHEILLAA